MSTVQLEPAAKVPDLYGIAILIVLIVWPRQRSDLAHFDPAKWVRHEGREGMVGDVVRMIAHDTIFSESTAEAHLGRPDHNQDPYETLKNRLPEPHV